MSNPQKPSGKPNLIPANFSDDDAAMSRKIFFGFLGLAGFLLIVLAIPGLKSLMEKL